MAEILYDQGATPNGVVVWMPPRDLLNGQGGVAHPNTSSRAGSPSSFVEIRRLWKDDRVGIELPKRLASERLPGSSDIYAFMDGPDHEREWGRWRGGYRTRGQDPGIRFMTLREVGYERYSVYFPAAPRR